MSTPFLAELYLLSFNFAPHGFALSNGQLLAINTNQALFSLLGTTFGGDGRVNFALPDLRGKVPIHMGGGFTLGERSGQETHTLTLSELGSHTHNFNVSSSAPTLAVADNTSSLGQGPVLGTGVNAENIHLYTNAAPGSDNPVVNLASASITNTGGGQPHSLMQPYLTLSYCIALQGIFPSQN
ncbi:MAG TPA: tail fiber protein [Mucilaginibacter sp.]|nr:tail fiber protein [Mucilaginibacter sp.]